MEIGDPLEPIVVEPIEDPFRRDEPEPVVAPAPVPEEVPA